MNRIREVRKAKKLSQTELAEMLHVHQTAVSQWENGKTEPDMDNLCRIADIFGVTVDYLLGVDTQSQTIDEQLSVCSAERTNFNAIAQCNSEGLIVFSYFNSKAGHSPGLFFVYSITPRWSGRH